MLSAPPSFRTAASALANDIRADIISGHLPPGGRLRIKELCERYGSGAIPLREALSRLATSGFVVAEDQRGFRVADVSAAELTDITDTRIHVECEALRRAIAQGGLDWEERLAGAHYRLGRVALRLPDDSGLNPEWEQAHAAFHSALISGSGSNSLIAIAELLRDQTARYRHLSVAGASGSAPAPGRDVAREHRELLEATLARDAVRASDLLAEHLRRTTELVLAHASRQWGAR
ncbi:GntR family transcriptional regulator [Achromobacter sp. AONIH1]|uniref:GntR family transcriptional regulator n=1 Tax=unclassified Achromobacter TaxID=2626865 RepID=UPI000CD064EF|nr:FCD domain-containing protein [Achromobacter sp. AONIH1]AUT49856.1 GntR family transcriptional regulator [Achromobacter sp. AONIH1]